ncbi:MAG: diacylglycerol kinase family lipid kinase [Chloroflexi bacterium]|nr:diacylglycerol kinase family lipid kinase [Chloroflexota bacterium]
MRTLVIYNPRAGRLPVRALAECAANWWRGLGWEVEIEGTHSHGDATRLARHAAETGFDAVIVAGGDGTLGQAADSLAGTSTALGVLPVGTSNVWARELCLPLSMDSGPEGLARVARVLAESVVRPVDMARAGTRHYLLWAGVGLDAHIVSRVEPRAGLRKQLGMAYYIMASFVAAIDWQGAEMQLEVDGEAIAGHMLLVLIGNNRIYAGGVFNGSPGAKLDDGLLELWAFEGQGYLESLALARELRRGRHVDHPRIKHRTLRRITITAERPVPVQADGELLDSPTPVTIEVAPLALRVLVPRSAPSDLFVG